MILDGDIAGSLALKRNGIWHPVEATILKINGRHIPETIEFTDNVSHKRYILDGLYEPPNSNFKGNRRIDKSQGYLIPIMLGTTVGTLILLMHRSRIPVSVRTLKKRISTNADVRMALHASLVNPIRTTLVEEGSKIDGTWLRAQFRVKTFRKRGVIHLEGYGNDMRISKSTLYLDSGEQIPIQFGDK